MVAETVTIAGLGHAGDGVAEWRRSRPYLTLPGETVRSKGRRPAI
jgi:hypothetical protein